MTYSWVDHQFTIPMYVSTVVIGVYIRTRLSRPRSRLDLRSTLQFIYFSITISGVWAL